LHRKEGRLSPEEKSVFNSIKDVGIKIPIKEKHKKVFFKALSTQLRTQTGQRDMVLNGILRSLPYLPLLDAQFKNFKIPKELLAIAFVESSFNLHAESYAGASGIWQFMPRTAASFMPERTKYIDYRSNPLISSIAAFHLLKQNKTILKRWDLAVPAYNFGTSHLVKARRKFKEKATLQHILENYSHNQVGFASNNYYSEFLAMVYALAYKDIIYPLSGYKKNGEQFKKENIALYVSKCRLRPHSLFSGLNKYSPAIQKLNPHFLQVKPTYSKDKLVVSDVGLSSRFYRKVTDKELLDYYPKNLHKLNHKSECGKRH
jgi:membrane-bound lytic murein transglycosylase D